MLTVNADQHPVMSTCTPRGKQKRSVVIVPRVQWQEWLTCRNPELVRSFTTLYPEGQMETEPAPIVRRAKELPVSADVHLSLYALYPHVGGISRITQRRKSRES
ncbi:hypothetical protein [Cupriavidus lacunae]